MRKGFTLLEMIFVLSVISIVFLLTIPNIQNVLSIAYSRGCDAQVKLVDAAILEYQLKNDTNPSSISDLVSDELLTERQTECSDHRSIDIVDGQAYAS